MREYGVSADTCSLGKSQSARAVRSGESAQYADTGRTDRSAPVCVTAGAVERRMSMYCNGNCEFLDKKRKKCKADGKIIAVMKVKGKPLSYDCYEHIVGCVKDREGEANGEA